MASYRDACAVKTARQQETEMNEGSLRRDFLKVGAIGAATSVLAGGSKVFAAAQQQPTADDFNIRSFGASGDGKTIDTQSVNRAIDAASAAGGGTVVFPAGSYLCYSIHLKSKVSLYLGPGATLVAAETSAAGGSNGNPTRGTTIRTSDTAIGATVLSGAKIFLMFPFSARD
jgi:polygalacturonase